MWMNQVNNIFDWQALHKIDKAALYALSYGSAKPVQARMDEEGCGAVFAAACLTPV